MIFAQWFSNITIRRRILFVFTALSVVGSALQLVIAGGQIQNATLDYARHHLETHALLAASALAEPLKEYAEGERGLGDFSRVLGVEIDDHTYLILDSNRRVMGFSAGAPYRPNQQVPNTPELVQASQAQVGSTMRDGQFCVSAQVQYEGQAIGYIVVLQPVAPAYAEAMTRWLQLILALLPVIGLVVLASLWIASTILRPVEVLRSTALQMAGGDLTARVPAHGKDEVGQLGNAFNHMADQLAALMQAQRSFVSNAAHELRTPMMTLKLRIEALQDPALPAPERRAYLAEARTEIDHMAHLVTSLLILARIDEGRHPVETETEEYDTEALLRDIARHWRIEAGRANLGFRASIPSDLPPLGIPAGDLRIVLANLLENAVKYTPQGQISLEAAIHSNELRIRIEDTGIGFTAEQGSALFERFFRAEDARLRASGTGLGLAIVGSLLQQWGGSVRATSQGPGSGAVFEIALPLTKNAAKATKVKAGVSTDFSRR